MGYFQRKRTGDDEQYTRKFEPVGQEDAEPEEAEAYEDEVYYDDALSWDDDVQGDDELPQDEEDEEWTEEELAEEKKRKFRIAAGIGDVLAILAGTAAILVLTALLISMIHFVTSDLSQSFTIWSTRF